MTPAVHLNAVSKRFAPAPNPPALAPTSFSIGEGQVVAILGPSGCGKTTLLHLIAGLQTPSTGSITIWGKSPDEVRRAGQIGFAFQEARLIPWRSVSDNLLLPWQIKNGRTERPDTKHWLKTFGLDDTGNQYPNQLSGGMAKRVNLARALLASPRLFLLDEPFGGLDWLLKRRLAEYLSTTIREKGMTTVIVTHDLDEAVFLADEIVILGNAERMPKIPVVLSKRDSATWSSREFQQELARFEKEVESLL